MCNNIPKNIALTVTFIFVKLLSLFWDSEIYYHVKMDLLID